MPLHDCFRSFLLSYRSTVYIPTSAINRGNSIRLAHHAAQGRANGPKNGPGKRLGAKKSDHQFVVPGNIIFRQRGTHWYPGENCGMGRDHTIYAKEKGYVVYYKDPEQLSLGVGAAGYGGAGGTVGKRKIREKRKYIGVVLEREEQLPRPRGAVRRRRLGMEARVMEDITAEAEAQAVANERMAEQDQTTPTEQPKKERKKALTKQELLPLRPGYMYRLGNWQIGRAAEKSKQKVRAYQRGDRFLAWRKRTARRTRAIERRSLRSKGKKKPRGGR